MKLRKREKCNPQTVPLSLSLPLILIVLHFSFQMKGKVCCKGVQSVQQYNAIIVYSLETLHREDKAENNL